MKKLQKASVVFFMCMFFAACGEDPSSPNSANPAQENILPGEFVKVEFSSSSVGKTGLPHVVSSSSKGKKSELTTKSSSSEAPKSSAENSVDTLVVDSPINTVETDTILIDERDGQVYRTVTIGSQTWMAENLNYETDSSYCYNDSASYCDKYGRIYSWVAAQDACPSGYHLPSGDEWQQLIDAVGGKYAEYTAGKMLRSKNGWGATMDGRDGNGTDDFSFTALPAGSVQFSQKYNSETKKYSNEVTYSGVGSGAAYFWCSGSTGCWAGTCAQHMVLRDDDAYVSSYWDIRYSGYPVRCLKDGGLSSSSSQTVKSSSSTSAQLVLLPYHCGYYAYCDDSKCTTADKQCGLECLKDRISTGICNTSEFGVNALIASCGCWVI